MAGIKSFLRGNGWPSNDGSQRTRVGRHLSLYNWEGDPFLSPPAAEKGKRRKRLSAFKEEHPPGCQRWERCHDVLVSFRERQRSTL